MPIHMTKHSDSPQQASLSDLVSSYDARALSLLNQVRFQAVSCRAAKFLAFEEACRLIQVDSQIAFDQHLSAFVRVLGQAIGRPAVIHAPGTASLSFDEKWLLQIFEQALIDDRAGFRFLVRSRVSRYKQTSFASLALRLVAALERHSQTR